MILAALKSIFLVVTVLLLLYKSLNVFLAGESFRVNKFLVDVITLFYFIILAH